MREKNTTTTNKQMYTKTSGSEACQMITPFQKLTVDFYANLLNY